MLCAPLYSCWALEMVQGGFPLPVPEGAARVFVEWFRCAVPAAQYHAPAQPAAAKQQNLMGEHGAWNTAVPRTCAAEPSTTGSGTCTTQTDRSSGKERALMMSVAAAARGNANGP